MCTRFPFHSQLPVSLTFCAPSLTVCVSFGGALFCLRFLLLLVAVRTKLCSQLRITGAEAGDFFWGPFFTKYKVIFPNQMPKVKGEWIDGEKEEEEVWVPKCVVWKSDEDDDEMLATSLSSCGERREGAYLDARFCLLICVQAQKNKRMDGTRNQEAGAHDENKHEGRSLDSNPRLGCGI